jgi:hypothetical protein
MPRKGGGGGAAAAAALEADPRAWLRSYPAVAARLEAKLGGRSLGEAVDAAGGLLLVRDLFPRAVAAAAAATLAALPDAGWRATAAADDAAANDVAHRFRSTKAGPGLAPLLRALGALAPGALAALSAAEYRAGDGIAPHDDRHYVPVAMEDGSVVECSRAVAVVWYAVPRDWSAADGGALVDLEAGAEHLPRHNALAAFRVPRWHAVAPVAGGRPRRSIFGWFLEPGRLYPLQPGAAPPPPPVAAGAAPAPARAAPKRRRGGGEAVGGAAEARREGGGVAAKKKRRKRKQERGA